MLLSIYRPLPISSSIARHLLHRFPRFVLIAATCFALSWQTPSLAQNANVQNAQNTVDFKMRSDARIDPSSLSLQLQIPLGNYPGRGGAGLPVTLYYSSKLWRIEHKDTTVSNGETDSRFQAKYGDSTAAGWTSSLDWFKWPSANNINYQGFEQPLEKYGTDGKLVSGTAYNRTVARMHVVLPDGSRHELRRDDAVLGAGSNTTTGTFYSVDGSRLRYESSNKTLYLSDGSMLRYETDVNGVPVSMKYIDRNGNQNTYSHATGLWTDATGRTLGPPPLSQTVGDYPYALPGIGGSSITYTLRGRNLADVRQPDANGQIPGLRFKGDRALLPPHLISMRRDASRIKTSISGTTAVGHNPTRPIAPTISQATSRRRPILQGESSITSTMRRVAPAA